MPIHLDDRDMTSEVAGLSSVLIVPCNMCPAVTVAVREEKPFLQLFRNFLKSAPFARYLEAVQSRLRGGGIYTKVFESNLPHQWFMCMWTSGRRRKLQRQAREHEAIIVFGCESATETVRDAVKSTDTRVIEGMTVAGVMNAMPRLRLPGSVSFEDCKVVPFSRAKKREQAPV